MEISHKYDDIIDLPHHVSETRAHMSMTDRAAQFSPFAALTGYGEAVEETARLTQEQKELTEEEKAAISWQLSMLQEQIRESPRAAVVWFQPDERKSGGSYRRTVGQVRKIDSDEARLLFSDGTSIPFDRILSIDTAADETV